MRVLGALASSGRTSLPFDGEISRESYRIAGYRPCGERIVRVDVVERLAGIIRTAIVGGPEGGAAGLSGQQKSKGFVVTGQMTSLTGCSGEQFASILRSMGFQSVQMTRSDFFGSSSVSESTKEREPLAPAEPSALTAQDQTTPTAACEEGTSVEDLVAVSSIASPAEGAPRACLPARHGRRRFALRRLGARSRAPNPGQAARAQGATRQSSCGGPRGARRPTAGPGAELSPTETSFPPASIQGSGRRAVRTMPVVAPAPARKRMRNKNRSEAPSAIAAADARKAAERPGPRADRSDNVRADKKHRQAAISRDMPRSHPGPGQQPRAKVDPNSPFAKLLELRSLLEGQANKRP